jgi:hypothetical protein
LNPKEPIPFLNDSKLYLSENWFDNCENSMILVLGKISLEGILFFVLIKILFRFYEFSENQI